MKKVLFLLIGGLFITTSTLSQTTFVAYGSSWKYLDNGTNQGTAWRGTSFNDASWASGNAELGYGDGDETTVVSYGPNANQKYYTTYFRKTISITNAASYTGLTLNIKRDDGAVVYINGTERFRTNMPTGSITYTTRASTDASDDGETPQTISLGAGVLAEGTNVIAVEIHQRSRTSSDISFDLELTGAGDITAPTVTTYSPTDNAINVAINSSLVLTFNETVQKGVGDILVKQGGVTTQTIDVLSAGVTVAGNTVTIDPADLGYSASVNVEMPAGTFRDLAGNNYAGISNAGTWNFTTITPDITPPVVTLYTPADDAVNVSVSSNLVLVFSEAVQKGAGNILVKQGGVTTQTINVSSATVTVAGNTVTIDPVDLGYSASVNVEIAAGVFQDLAGNNYAGISDATTWNFSTEDQPSGPQTLVAYGASWKYLDNGTNQGTAWRGTSFNDASWASGSAELGYGDGDETTVVSYGANASNKYITTYFRITFSAANPSQFSVINGNLFRDDGVAVYINGTEVYRNNLAAGATYTTLATLASDDGETAQSFSFSPSLLVSGNNVIAVEIHQNTANSSDISMNLQLIANTAGGATLTRGPYLNMGNQTAVTLRWRTDVATNSKVELGTAHGTYPLVFNDAVSTTEHEIRVTGLNPDTKYFYRFGSSTQALQAGTDNYFITTPAAATTRKLRFAVFGDCGRNDNGYQSQTLAAYQNYLGSNNGEIMILLGDNAYTNGTDAEYQTGFFTPYQSTILKNHIIMPTPGNHDYYGTNQASRTGAYYQNFTIPAAGECGGVISGTEAFYSWDRGDVHFISLDSYGTESPDATRLYDTLGPQVTWLKQDLSANSKKWTIVYWHHPPYTMGSHNSDTETELVNIRTNLLRILERQGVDLILCGHSHDYERSYLLKDYFGNEASFNVNTHAVSNSSASYDQTANSCPYNLANGQVNHGTVYVVSGSSGASGGIQTGYPHNAMPWSFNDGGMLQLEIEGNRLDAKFIRRNQVIADQFTIMKDVNKTNNLVITPGTPTQLTASWIGNYSWNTGETTRTITVAPVANTTYTVTDGLSCLSDVFNITVTGSRNQPGRNTAESSPAEASVTLSPVVVRRGQPVQINASTLTNESVIIVDAGGRVLRSFNLNQVRAIQTGNLPAGVYYLRLLQNGRSVAKKFIVVN